MADKIFGKGLNPIPLKLVATPVVTPAFNAASQPVYIAGLGNVTALKGAAVANLAALTAVAAVAAPTKAEFDKVVVDLEAARATLNALLASLRAANLIA